MVVVRANVVSAAASSYAGISGDATHPAHSFQASPGTGMFLGASNSIGFSSNSQTVATIASNGTVTASRFAGNVDGSYLDGNVQGEFVIVSGSIDCATNLSGTIPQINLPQSIGNVLTVYNTSNGSAEAPAIAFSSNSGAYASNGNIGISVNGVGKALVHSDGLTVYGNITGGFVSDASLLTVGTLDTRRLPGQVVIETIKANGAQFASLQAGNVQVSKFNALTISSNTVMATTVVASRVIGNVSGDVVGNVIGTVVGVISGNVSGNGFGLTINAANTFGVLPQSAFPPSIVTDVSGNLSGNGYGVTKINAANIIGILPTSSIPTTLDLLNIQSDNAQFSSVQAAALQSRVVHADKITATTLQANISGNANVSGVLLGTVFGTVIGNVFGNIVGNGLGIQNMNASAITTGTLAAARLPVDIAANSVSANAFIGVQISGENIVSGTIDNARLPQNIDVFNIQANGIQTLGMQAIGIQTSKIDALVATVQSMSANVISAPLIKGTLLGNVFGNVSGNISGNGFGLVVSASSITAGTIDNTRLAPTVIVQNVSGNLFGNGGGISDINAANISTGQLNTARLPANILVTSVKSASSFAETSQANATQVTSGQFLSIQASNVQVQKFTACTATVSSISTSNIASPSFTFPKSNTGMIFSKANVVTFSANGTQIAQLSETFTGIGKNITGFEGSICLNSTGTQLTASQPGFFVSPIRSTVATTPVLTLNSTTNEITYSSSTRRIKTNIVDLQKDTSVIFDVRPREFDSLEDHSHHIGFIAEEVDAIDPAFAWSLNGQIQGINWFTLLTYALAELKKVRAELDELKSVIL